MNPDGSPHVTGVGAFWDDGAFWVVTGLGTRKGRNLTAEPRCAVSVATSDYDLVVEGTAALVTDPQQVARIAAVVGVPDRPDLRNGARHERAGRRHPVDLLTGSDLPTEPVQRRTASECPECGRWPCISSRKSEVDG